MIVCLSTTIVAVSGTDNDETVLVNVLTKCVHAGNTHFEFVIFRFSSSQHIIDAWVIALIHSVADNAP
jgi:hypothetical protein